MTMPFAFLVRALVLGALLVPASLAQGAPGAVEMKEARKGLLTQATVAPSEARKTI